MMRRIWRVVSIALLNSVGRAYFRWSTRRKDFTIFSNDCYGAEVYSWLRLPYNTPFVGLMLMAPCYVNFLKRPQHYLSQTLRFTDHSAYPGMDEIRCSLHGYPLAMLDDIEIHFLHYTSQEEASQKWARRAARINWQNIKVKFAMDKDFATPELLQQFEKLPYAHKICVSKNDYSWAASNIRVPGFQTDATVTFRHSLRVFDICNWLNNGEASFKNSIRRWGGKLLYHTLRK